MLPLLAPIALLCPWTSDDPHIARVESGLRPPTVYEGEEGWKLVDRMKHYGIPGVGIAVIHEGRIAWTRFHGVTDHQTGEPVNESTLFQAGSVSKPVAAFGALHMVAEDKLSLEAPVNDALSSWKLPESRHDARTPLTLVHLLSHTGSVTVHGFPGYAVGEPVPTLVEVLDGSGPANTAPIRLDGTPGRGWRYSGGGYSIAQQMMIDAAGRTFPELMHERVLAPLGMTRSTFAQPLPPELLGHAAAGYLPDRSAVAGKRHTYPEMAAAGLWTTAEDLARFAIGVQEALAGESDVLSQELAQRMVHVVGGNYGLGFGVELRGEDLYFQHGGWDEGFCATLRAHGEAGYGVVVMINSNHPAFMDEIVRAVAYEYGWAGYERSELLPVPPEHLATVPGRYRYNAEQAFTLRASEDRLWLEYLGASPLELFYTEADDYVFHEPGSRVSFLEEEGEFVVRFTRRGGTPVLHHRLAEMELLPRELLFEGSYDEALAAYRDILELEPGNFAVSEDYLDEQGRRLLNTGRPEQALLLLRIARDLRPDSARAWTRLGTAQAEAMGKEEAIQSFEKALAIDPEYSPAVEALARLRR